MQFWTEQTIHWHDFADPDKEKVPVEFLIWVCGNYSRKLK